MFGIVRKSTFDASEVSQNKKGEMPPLKFQPVLTRAMATMSWKLQRSYCELPHFAVFATTRRSIARCALRLQEVGACEAKLFSLVTAKSSFS
jgi:hypothetical protein